MLTLFDKSDILDCDCYVADYTESSNNKKKVEISTKPFDDIAYFHFQKRRQSDKIPYIAVNLEKYPAFIEGIENCECMFKALGKDENTWMMFLELKYCKDENIEDYSFKAYSQMNATLSKLEKMGFADRKRNNVYFVYSVPKHQEKQPFGAWTISQNNTLKEMESSGIHMLGYCKILIATPHFLFPPKIKE